MSKNIITKINEVQSTNPNPYSIVDWLNNHPNDKAAIMFEYAKHNTGNMGDSVLIACELIKNRMVNICID